MTLLHHVPDAALLAPSARVEPSAHEPRSLLRDMRAFLAQATESQLTSLEWLPKRTSRSERRRQTGIARQMVSACRRFDVQPEIYRGRRACSRLVEQMGASGNGE